jgi:hypothetical protein
MESKSKESKGASFAEWALWFWGGFSLFSAMVWMAIEPDNNWHWFSRFALGAICFGFAGIMRELRKTREKQN